MTSRCELRKKLSHEKTTFKTLNLNENPVAFEDFKQFLPDILFSFKEKFYFKVSKFYISFGFAWVWNHAF
jgi:hypothetical protein